MKRTSRIGLIIGVSLGIAIASKALDFSESVTLERYTIETDGSLQDDEGFLEKNGTFNAISSEIVPPWEIPSIDDFIPISGRPIIDEQLYEDYQSAGVIPHWTRSLDEFFIGDLGPYVIVSVKGGEDPNPIPVIFEEPQSEDMPLGSMVWFSVDADPADYLSYQWQFAKHGSSAYKSLAGETASFIGLTNITTTEAGSYRVLLSTGGKAVASQAAVLNVIVPIVITKEPQPHEVKTGSTVTFSVTVTGTSPTYQWYFNGALIPNATKSSLTVKKVNEASTGSYSVSIMNEFSSVLSTMVALTLKP